MKISLTKCPSLLFVILLIMTALPARASHLTGDQFFYKLVDSTRGSYTYQVTLILYADGLNGAPEAVAQDNPAFLAIFRGGTYFLLDTALYYDSSYTVSADLVTDCGMLLVPPYVTLKRVFIKNYTLPASATGYTLVYQRCCYNAEISSVIDPGNAGATYVCNIPPSGTATYNNCAVFRNETPQFIGLDMPFRFDCSASDADGDSLSYGFTVPENCCGGGSNVKPEPTPPPFDSVTYLPLYSSVNPVPCSVPLQIDPATGIMTGTPNLAGRYLISVFCNEYRLGTLINTSSRAFEVTVVPDITTSYRPHAGYNTVIYVGDTVQFDASGAVTYAWSPATYLSNDSISNPVGRYPVPGIFSYVLTGVSDSGCVGTDTVSVTVISVSDMAVPTAFTPNGDGRDDQLIPIPVLGSRLVSFSVYNVKGDRLFSTNNALVGWDGTCHGVKQDIGTYYWELSFIDNAGKTRKKTGSATLIR